MRRLCGISRKKTRLVVGMMSGTSHDGVDAAVARVTGTGKGVKAVFLRHDRSPYPKALREKVARAFNGSTADVCRLNFELGEFFAGAALSAIKKAGLSPGQVDLIGSHGQTIYHEPPAGNRPGSTLQIGEGAVIAERTGVLTVSDFRTADVAAGGHGAPLVPYADWVLFRKPGKVSALQNIGGISNVTVVTEDISGVYGFDTGPGCSLLDEAVKILSGGELSYDKDGKIAKSGKIIPELYKNLSNNPYFKKIPPKSTGRETFGKVMAEDIVKQYRRAGENDILCTLTHLTAGSIMDAYADFVFPRHRVDRILLAGGGARNGFLVELLRGIFPGISVALTDEAGVPVEAREALCFAVLASETVSGSPGNVPAATGAKHPAVLGKISV
jgi:anhydro-N-acetylmuramic acid kinase